MTSGPPSILLSVAYDGRPFHGFAVQAKLRTVAGDLLEAITKIDPSVIEVRGSSRTDSGVHALDQRVAFDPSRHLPPRAWIAMLNRKLPPDIAIRTAWSVPRGFQPRRAARWKSYRYTLLLDRVRDPRWIDRAWRVPELTLDKLDVLAAELSSCVGEHDFAGFRGAADRRVETVRTILRADVSVSTDLSPLVLVDVTGTGFMYNMVRILVGTAVDVARRRKPVGSIAKTLATCVRTDAGITAPPDGLCLMQTEIDIPDQPADD